MKKEVGLLLLLTQAAMASPDPAVVCSSKPVEAAVGENVILQCHLDPPLDATNATVEWSHKDHNNSVHLYQDRKDNPAEQSEHFEGRTSLFSEELTKENLSLKLSSVQLSDSGRYRCSFSSEKHQSSCYVDLTVALGNSNRAEQTDDSSPIISENLRIGIIAAVVIVIVIIIIAISVMSVRNHDTSSEAATFLQTCLRTCLGVFVDLFGQRPEES